MKDCAVSWDGGVSSSVYLGVWAIVSSDCGGSSSSCWGVASSLSRRRFAMVCGVDSPTLAALVHEPLPSLSSFPLGRMDGFTCLLPKSYAVT